MKLEDLVRDKIAIRVEKELVECSARLPRQEIERLIDYNVERVFEKVIDNFYIDKPDPIPPRQAHKTGLIAKRK